MHRDVRYAVLWPDEEGEHPVAEVRRSADAIERCHAEIALSEH